MVSSILLNAVPDNVLEVTDQLLNVSHGGTNYLSNVLPSRESGPNSPIDATRSQRHLVELFAESGRDPVLSITALPHGCRGGGSLPSATLRVHSVVRTPCC